MFYFYVLHYELLLMYLFLLTFVVYRHNLLLHLISEYITLVVVLTISVESHLGEHRY